MWHNPQNAVTTTYTVHTCTLHVIMQSKKYTAILGVAIYVAETFQGWDFYGKVELAITYTYAKSVGDALATKNVKYLSCKNFRL